MLFIIGCQTVPRHLVREEVIVYYYEPILVDLPPIGGPHPPPDPPYNAIKNPDVNNPGPSRDLQSKNPTNGGSYGNRDPLQGGGNLKTGETKTYPPVRKPEKNARVQ